MKTMTAKFNGLRRDLQEGREWLVTSERSGNTYAVTFYIHNGLRYGYCSCPAGSREVFCRHLPFTAGCDSQLIKAPLPVESCPLCSQPLNGEHYFHLACGQDENARDEWAGSEPNADGQAEVMEYAV